MRDKIAKLVLKYTRILETIKANKAMKVVGDNYPYDLDIKLTREVIRDLKNLLK